MELDSQQVWEEQISGLPGIQSKSGRVTCSQAAKAERGESVRKKSGFC
jgi:hypothetical protein